MASQIDVANEAMILLGANTINSFSENSKNARAISQQYDSVRQGELRKRTWNFAIKMAQLAASSSAPLFDRDYIYPLPTDFLALIDPFPESNLNDRDWVIQNEGIYTNDPAPLNFRYVADITDVNKMDALFRNSLSAALAVAVGMQVTQSATKMQFAQQQYESAIRDAKRANAFEQISATPPIDEWITVRR